MFGELMEDEEDILRLTRVDDELPNLVSEYKTKMEEVIQ